MKNENQVLSPLVCAYVYRCTGSPCPFTPCYVYNKSSNVFELSGNLLRSRHHASSVPINDGQDLFVIGGDQTAKGTEIFSPNLGTSTEGDIQPIKVRTGNDDCFYL